MPDLSRSYEYVTNSVYKQMLKSENKYSDRVLIDSNSYVTKLKFNDMKNRFNKYINDNGVEPSRVYFNLGYKNTIKTYSKENMAVKSNDIIKETKRLGKHPEHIHIRNRENNNLDVLLKEEYMGLFENQNVFWIKHNYVFPNYTTLNTKANNPVVMDYQNNSVNCFPASASMASQMLFKNTTEQTFAKVCLTNENGTDPKNLFLVNKLGFTIKAIARNNKAVKNAIATGNAVIAHIQTKSAKCLKYVNDYGHYVLIDRVSDTQYHVCDPTKGINWCDFGILDKATNGRSISYYEMKTS